MSRWFADGNRMKEIGSESEWRLATALQRLININKDTNFTDSKRQELSVVMALVHEAQQIQSFIAKGNPQSAIDYLDQH